MTPDELDVAYTALCEALGRVGADAAPLLLATLALDLMTREPNLEAVLPLVERAERLSRN